MGTLTITKAYADLSPLMESHIDNFRNGLHTLFNTDKLSAANFSDSMELTSAKFQGTYAITVADGDSLYFGSSDDAWLGLDSSKNFEFDTAETTTEIRFYAGETYYLEIWTDKIYVPGDLILNNRGSGRTLLQALSSYRKPVLEWAGATAVSLQNNSGTTNESILIFPDGIFAITEVAGGSSKYRQALITSTANGYGTSDVGAATGGRRSGVSLTANTWYAVYACKLRSSSDYDADTGKFILVYDTTMPTVANESTLDGYYGTDCWVYLGTIHYGMGGTNTNNTTIPKFKYSNKGWCHFYEAPGTLSSVAYRGGITLAESVANTDDTTAFYSFSTASVPSIFGHVVFQVTRQAVSDWYIKDSATNIIWRGGWQTETSSLPHGFMVELPVATYTFHQERKGTGGVTKLVSLAGFCDGYLLLRRQGHGI